MGLTANILKFQEEIIQDYGLRWDQIIMCELGAQYMRTINIPAKKYYIDEKKVLEHISIDWNGLYGALKIDLRFPIPISLLNKFHLVTDFGTIEHVDNQYQVFKNVHNMCNKKGIILHVLPSLNYLKKHCHYFYSESFFILLAKLCNYKILKIKTQNAYKPPLPKSKVIYAAFFKQENNRFITNEEFNEIEKFNFRNITKTRGDYLWNFLWKILRLRRYLLLAYRKRYLNKYFKNYKKEGKD